MNGNVLCTWTFVSLLINFIQTFRPYFEIPLSEADQQSWLSSMHQLITDAQRFTPAGCIFAFYAPRSSFQPPLSSRLKKSSSGKSLNLQLLTFNLVSVIRVRVWHSRCIVLCPLTFTLVTGTICTSAHLHSVIALNRQGPIWLESHFQDQVGWGIRLCIECLYNLTPNLTHLQKMGETKKVSSNHVQKNI